MAALAESIDAPRKVPRIGLLDTLRGIALLAMASYHGTWDFEFFGYLDPGTAETGWLKIYARVIASTFLFMAGFSLVLANWPKVRWPSYGKRLAMIVASAAAISIVTFFAMPDEWIFFGILHSIAAASIIGLIFLRLPSVVTLLVAVLLLFGVVTDNIFTPLSLHSTFFDPWWLWWVGLSENLQRSNDYVPLFPWLTPFLFGLGAAQLALAQGWLAPLSRLGTGSNIVARTGRHSLVFYLLHQPILFGLVYLLSVVVPAAKPDPSVVYLGQCQSSCIQSATESLCRSFCQCTLDQMKAKSLFEPLQSGAIHADNNDQIQGIALQCTEQAQ